MLLKPLSNPHPRLLSIEVHDTLRKAPGQPEVTDFNVATRGDEHVCTLQITVDDVALVQKAQRAEKVVDQL